MLVLRPGSGWKHLANTTYEHSSGVRITTSGLVRLPSGPTHFWLNNYPEGILGRRLIKINGGNRKRGLMAWAINLALQNEIINKNQTKRGVYKMRNAPDIFSDLPNGSGFVDGIFLDNLQLPVLCSDRLPKESGVYAIKHNGGCNNGNGEMYFSTETGWDVPDMIKSFYRVIGWYES